MDTASPIISGPTAAESLQPSRRRRKADRLAIAEAWAASGMNAADFASQHDVTVSSLTRWKRELSRDRVDGANGSFVELPVPHRCSTRAAIEVVIAGRHHVRVTPDFDETTLSRVVRVLQNAPAT
jgi:transposase-like protein